VELGFLAGWNSNFEQTHGRTCAHGTLRLLIQALRSFYAFLDRYDLLVDADGQPVRDPLRRIDGPKSAHRANDWLRAREEQQLLAATITPEERIVITLLRWSGLRCGEAVQLLVRDIDFDRQELHVRHSKTRTGLRTVPLLPGLERELQVWLQHVQAQQPVAGDAPLLVTRNQTPMKAQLIVRIVRRAAQRAALREAV